MPSKSRLYSYYELPWNLRDVVKRVMDCKIVYGWELALLADAVSQ